MNLTIKQIALLKVVHTGNTDGSPVDLDEILERLDYDTTKQSLQFSLRALIAKGLLEKAGTEKRRNRVRVLFELTSLGAAMFSAPVAAAPKADPEPVYEVPGDVPDLPVGDEYPEEVIEE